MSGHLETATASGASSLIGADAFRAISEWVSRHREAIFRAIAVPASATFVVRASLAFAANPDRFAMLLVVVSELLATVLLLLSSTPKRRDMRPVALACALWSFVYAAFIGVDPGYHCLSGNICGVIGAAGLVLTITGKMAIGTSFGVLPATRAIVRIGPYRFIRHPIYVGYFITHAGFLLADFTLRNLIVLGSLHLCQVVRVLREEKLLGQEAGYRRYCRDVPYRFVYGLI
jgi:protein-S-isoprenylcysteine O-methyltransferase Ste14